MPQQQLTPRDLIQHIIPGVSLSTDAEALIAIEAARTVIDSRGGPCNALECTFIDWYGREYRDWLTDVFSD